MTFWAVVPAKPLARGKSRLAPALSPEERRRLNETLLEHTILTLSSVQEIEQILVVSRDSSALSIARGLGARIVKEDGAGSLSSALERASAVTRAHATDGVLVMPADLPLLGGPDILAILQRAHDPPVVVIAPDRRHAGTNALLLSPVAVMHYDFGTDSFARHCERALNARARLEIVETPSLGLDLDLPEDLELARQSR